MAAPVLDQHAHATSTGGTTTAIAVTTGAANTLILVAASIGGTSTSAQPSLSISGAGLTWTALDSAGAASGIGYQNYGNTVQAWWAFAAAQLTSQTVTVTSNQTIDDAALIYASFTGANAAHPVETASITARYATSASVMATALTSTNANDIGVAVGGTNSSFAISAVSAPNVLIDNVTNSGGSRYAQLGLAYQTFSTPQTGVSVGFTTNSAPYGLIGAMITADASGTAYNLAAAEGSYALTGGPHSLYGMGRYGMGLYSAAFWGVTLGVAVPAAQGAYALTGQAATLTLHSAHPTLAAAPGSYALAGQAATFPRAVTLSASPGAYALAGQAAAAIKVSPGDYVMIAPQGAYALIGGQVTMGYTPAALVGKAQKPYLREGTYRVRQLGWAFDPTFVLRKDRPGPIRIVEFSGWMN